MHPFSRQEKILKGAVSFSAQPILLLLFLFNFPLKMGNSSDK
ncbi:hypothetical protein POREN0001_0924 [Porphyromonas endodontalis ATCC 35406]|uniref:Uncharacterized protein n=1 Tax=Porphyromonas endodontalis (strain ATCC 35406 / DSM 24491 / JCM 8526 / CCUG 16442 / BCRC 14492 / NCTC 13058 / HG 370) TaxID=553175 RepID=C3JA02_POREA|nr:hypothetical protein POREN0001_0924 [Porphyromonas endodontalis ATCC 35406]